MAAEQLVIDQAFNHVEDPSARQYLRRRLPPRAARGAAVPAVSPGRRDGCGTGQ